MKRCRFITLSIMFHLLSGACLHLALAAGDPEITIRRTSSKIQIDGILNDAAWQEEPSLTALVQVEPVRGESKIGSI
jgi:hypothetical protein